MNVLEKLLVGKKLVSIKAGLYNWGICFDDGSAFAVYTGLETRFISRENENIVTKVLSWEKKLEIKLGTHSFIKFLLDDELLDGPEFFYYEDADGTIIVEN